MVSLNPNGDISVISIVVNANVAELEVVKQQENTMTLKDEIAGFDEEKAKNMPADILELMDRTTQELIATGLARQAKAEGSKAPEFTLPDHTGAQVSLDKLLEKGPVVLSFYRGGWCPYCNLELRALQGKLDELTAAGASLVAVSPELPDNATLTREENKLAFTVLSDLNNKVAKDFGLVFTLSGELQPVYKEFGLDVPARNGNESWDLPFPATYVIQPDRTISLAFVAADYTQRLEPQDVVDHLS